MDPFVILNDADVNALARMPALITVVERCLRAKANDRLVAPPRHSVLPRDIGAVADLVATASR